MTSLQSSVAVSFGPGAFDSMSDRQPDHHWQHQQHHSQQNQQHDYFDQIPLGTSPWQSNATPLASNHRHPQQLQVYGTGGANRNVYQATATSFDPYAGLTSTGLLAPNDVGFVTDPQWPSEMDVSTPSVFAPTQDPMDHVRTQASGLMPPANENQRPSSRHAHTFPAKALARPSNNLLSPDALRPTLQSRAKTAPVKPSAAAKRASKSPASDDSEEDFVPDDSVTTSNPTQSTTTTRGRKRTRIPHTAVERRYRENLNAHLERLRQTVPSVASRRPSGNAAARPGDLAIGEGAKPSKCEILNGAIEHIQALEREVAALRSENSELRARAQGLQGPGEGQVQGQGWYMGGVGRGRGYGE
nr:hypothetical protein B0A51_02358 [Rachicladosporium sp. CCFEE 5018]